MFANKSKNKFEEKLFQMICRLKRNEINAKFNNSFAAADITSVNKAKTLVNFILSDGAKY